MAKRDSTHIGPSRDEIIAARNQRTSASSREGIVIPGQDPINSEPGLMGQIQEAKEQIRKKTGNETSSTEGQDAQKDVEDALEMELDSLSMNADNPNPFFTPAYRTEIEKTLEPPQIDITGALFGRAKQTVTVNDQVKVEFQSIKGQESTLVESLATNEAEGESIAYYMQVKMMGFLAVGIVRVNEQVLPPLENDAGIVTPDTLKKRYDMVAKFNLMFLQLLAANHEWFEDRVRKALSPKAIVNF